jgi:transposase-like protein
VIITFLNNRSGVSARNIQRQIGVSYPTALRMLRQIRKAMSNEEEAKVFSGIVEVDETYIGGKPRKYNNKEGKKITKKQQNKRGRGTNKTPAVGVKDRETGQIYVKVILPNKEGQRLSGKQLIEVINAGCVEGTTVITDEFKGYNKLSKNGYIHYKVNHSLGQYSAGNGIHTNGIENFWSILKMGWYGTYRHMSIKYLQLYINEFCFRQNTRLHECAFDVLLKRTVINNPSIIEAAILKAI